MGTNLNLTLFIKGKLRQVNGVQMKTALGFQLNQLLFHLINRLIKLTYPLASPSSLLTAALQVRQSGFEIIEFIRLLLNFFLVSKRWLPRVPPL